MLKPSPLIAYTPVLALLTPWKVSFQVPTAPPGVPSVVQWISERRKSIFSAPRVIP